MCICLDIVFVFVLIFVFVYLCLYIQRRWPVRHQSGDTEAAADMGGLPQYTSIYTHTNTLPYSQYTSIQPGIPSIPSNTANMANTVCTLQYGSNTATTTNIAGTDLGPWKIALPAIPSNTYCLWSHFKMHVHCNLYILLSQRSSTKACTKPKNWGTFQWIWQTSVIEQVQTDLPTFKPRTSLTILGLPKSSLLGGWTWTFRLENVLAFLVPHTSDNIISLLIGWTDIVNIRLLNCFESVWPSLNKYACQPSSEFSAVHSSQHYRVRDNQLWWGTGA